MFHRVLFSTSALDFVMWWLVRN